MKTYVTIFFRGFAFTEEADTDVVGVATDRQRIYVFVKAENDQDAFRIALTKIRTPGRILDVTVEPAGTGV